MRGAAEAGRSLYIEGPATVTWRRGSLEVRCRDGRPRYYPLDRLARIVAYGDVRWQDDALTACAAGCVPVLATGADGIVRWTLVPGTSAGAGLGSTLVAARESPRWEARYRDWFDSQNTRLRRHTCVALGWTDEGDRRVWTRLDQQLDRAWGEQTVTRILKTLEPIVRAEVAEALAERDVPADLSGGWIGVSLVEDLATLLEWPLKGRLAAAARRHPRAPRTLEEIVSLYEEEAATTIRGAARRLVAYLWKLRP